MGAGGEGSMTLSQDYTFQFKDDGIILNTDSTALPFFDVLKVTGLDSAPIRTTEREREGMSGGFVDADYSKIRTIVIDGIVYGNQQNIQQYLADLKSNYAPSSNVLPFYFRPAGMSQKVLFVKSLGLKYDWDTSLRTGKLPIQIQLKAEDPTIYGDIITSTLTGLGGVASGRGYNKSYNFGYGGSTATSGALNVFNSGSKPVGAMIYLYNVSNPAVVSDTTGARLNFNTNIGDGDFYEADLYNRMVRLNKVANRRNTLLPGSTWFLLYPGNNQLRFLGTAYGTGTPKMIVQFRPGDY